MKKISFIILTCILLLTACTNKKEEIKLTVSNNQLNVTVGIGVMLPYEISGANYHDITFIYDASKISVIDHLVVEALTFGYHDIKLKIGDFDEVITVYATTGKWQQIFNDSTVIPQLTDDFNYDIQASYAMIEFNNIHLNDYLQVLDNLKRIEVGFSIYYETNINEKRVLFQETNNLKIYIIFQEISNPNSLELVLYFKEHFDFEFEVRNNFMVYFNGENTNQIEISPFLDEPISIEETLLNNGFIKISEFIYYHEEAFITITINDNQLDIWVDEMSKTWKNIQSYFKKTYEINLANFEGFDRIIIESNPESYTKYTYKLFGIEDVQKELNAFIERMSILGYELTNTSDSHQGTLINYDFEHIIIGYHESHGDSSAIDILITILPY
ncbi:hypothetical protein [Acholeplasma hippikon]|uniref:Uncharacterized protein n=1 Tax=Acholeplasma hippikon TaxID=264636 RepID=A0A449BIR7_9MOLU|nr:hypothetical protein [Acholeplasma hippikon]VEU82328.1 Uncharacterised protein [Acholeplasma hippikon]